MMSKIITLTQGREAIVDDDMFEYLNQWKWYYANGYAIRHLLGQHRIQLRMHRIILNTPDGMETDHINLNRLDNRRCNLRICTKSQNRKNYSKRSDNTSGFKGVTKNNRNWRAHINKDGESINLGTFKTKEMATRAYDEAARKYHGEFARVNFAEGKT
jgi:hypothetical protein